MKKENTPVRISIPVKPYLLKFILYIENIEEGSPIDLRQRGLTANTLKRLLTWKNEESSGKLSAGYTAELPVLIPPRHWQRGNWYLNSRSIQDFNAAMLQFFHEVLNFKMRMDLLKGLERKGSIEEFMDLLGIVDEVEYEAVKKANQRLREERLEVDFRKKTSPNGLFFPTNLSRPQEAL